MVVSWDDHLIDWAVEQGASLEVAESFMAAVQALGLDWSPQSWDSVLADMERAASCGYGDDEVRLDFRFNPSAQASGATPEEMEEAQAFNALWNKGFDRGFVAGLVEAGYVLESDVEPEPEPILHWTEEEGET